MKPNDDGVQVGKSNSDQGTARVPGSRLQIIAAAVGLVVLLIGGASTLPRNDADRANAPTAQLGSELQMQVEPTTVDYFPEWPERVADRADGATGQPEATAFVYFPAQYENQAREKEEHIQAF